MCFSLSQLQPNGLQRMATKRTTKPQSTYIIRAALKGKIYRDIEIASVASLHSLAFTIVEAFAFDCSHAFGFYSKLTGNIGNSPFRYDVFADEDGDIEHGVERTPVRTAFPEIGSKMLFLYDFGDEWRFTLRVIGVGETLPQTVYPRVVASVGDAPPQYPDPDEDGE